MYPKSSPEAALVETLLIENAVDQLRQRFLAPQCASFCDPWAAQPFPVGIICGSNFDKLVKLLGQRTTIHRYHKVLGLLESTVSGHAGGLVSGTIGGVPVLVACGRSHQYEDNHPWETVRLARVMGRLCQTVLTTAFVGSPVHPPRSAVLVDDVCTLFVTSPLIGFNLAELMAPVDKRECPRFPDMREPFSFKLQELMRQAASEANVALVYDPGIKRVYGGGPGPHYETRADVNALKSLGIDLFGMSMVLEAEVLTHMGVPLVGLAGVGNWATGCDPNWKPGDKIDHKKGMKIIAQIVRDLYPLIPVYVRRLARELG